jgi:sporulation protein YlmC with PRC-barrel domain
MDTLTQDNLSGTNREGLYSNLPLKYLTASTIMSDKVRNPKGEHMGSIKDIMINIITGTVEYYVIEFGGFLGFGIKYFAIPFKLLEVDAANKQFIFNKDVESLKNAPGFDMEHWPDTNIHFDQIYGYWSFMGEI